MGADAATYIGHDKVADALAKGGSLAATKEYTVSGSHRTRAGQVEVHEKETDILYVTDGEATFVTGGTMVGGKMSKAGQWLGTDITGGQTHHLIKGDVMTDPGGNAALVQGSSQVGELFRGESSEGVSMSRKISAMILGLAVVAALAPAANLDFNNPTGTQGLIMIDKLGGFVRFFDPVSLKELSSFAIPDGPPHELAISPDHKTAYIPIYGDGVYGRNPHPGHVIAIVDLASKKMTGTIDISPYIAPHGLQVDANGTLYATCDLSRKFLVIDPKTRTITAAIDTEGTGHWIAVLPDGSKAYVANKNDRPVCERDRY